MTTISRESRESRAVLLKLDFPTVLVPAVCAAIQEHLRELQAWGGLSGFRVLRASNLRFSSCFRVSEHGVGAKKRKGCDAGCPDGVRTDLVHPMGVVKTTPP